jgi:hypothetical protein
MSNFVLRGAQMEVIRKIKKELIAPHPSPLP